MSRSGLRRSSDVRRSSPQHFVAQVKLGDNGHNTERAHQVNAVAQKFGGEEFSQTDSYMRFMFREVDDLKPFLLSDRIHRRGRGSSQRGTAVWRSSSKWARLPVWNKPSTFQDSTASHGIGHTRLSTESVVDLSHSQPFWGHGYPDLAIVHNGHITNYHQLRRRYEQHGVRFYTENDSEIVAIFLARQTEAGRWTCAQRYASMVTELDGSFSCLAATESAFGFVKDPFSFKPLLFAETGRFCGLATEEIAIRGAIPGRLRSARSPGQGSAGMAEIDAAGRSTREINAAIRSAIAGSEARRSPC